MSGREWKGSGGWIEAGGRRACRWSKWACRGLLKARSTGTARPRTPAPRGGGLQFPKVGGRAIALLHHSSRRRLTQEHRRRSAVSSPSKSGRFETANGARGRSIGRVPNVNLASGRSRVGADGAGGSIELRTGRPKGRPVSDPAKRRAVEMVMSGWRASPCLEGGTSAEYLGWIDRSINRSHRPHK